LLSYLTLKTRGSLSVKSLKSLSILVTKSLHSKSAHILQRSLNGRCAPRVGASGMLKSGEAEAVDLPLR
jgi:hypothetical protein